MWISGLFNPMGYVTACLQMTARAKALPLDSMMISTEVMDFHGEQCEGQPEEGTYVHGLFMEGAKWSTEANSVFESDPKVGAPRASASGARGRSLHFRPIEPRCFGLAKPPPLLTTRSCCPPARTPFSAQDLHPVMPVIKIRGLTDEELRALTASSGDVTYDCPVYTTTIRGPTFTFAAPLRTVKPPWVWILAGVCLVMQPD